jgi:hypothetical protein
MLAWNPTTSANCWWRNEKFTDAKKARPKTKPKMRGLTGWPEGFKTKNQKPK